MKKSKPTKPYWEMNTEELAEATKEFDRELDLSKTRPLTKQEQARWEQARRRPSRSIFLKKSKPVTVRLEESLIRKSDEYAKKHGLTRSDVINKSLQATLSFAD